MELARLIKCLTCPEAYPFPVEAVEVCQTHISVVFLARNLAYKVKKPVRFDFLDFSTLEQRRHFCREELRLNRRLAPDDYLDVVPIVETGEGLKVEGQGEAIEWAVKMRRLPEAATLREMVKHGEVRMELMETIAGRIADFHRRAHAGSDRAGLADFKAIHRNLLDIYDQAAPHIGGTVSAVVHARLRNLTEESLSRLKPLIESRVSEGKICEGHGDLHLSHIYSFPERSPAGDLVIVDCIEFNERFRFIDPVADSAFLIMDLAFQGRRDLARAFADAYFRFAADEEGKCLLPLYTAYRATVRALVESLKLEEKEVPEAEKQISQERSRGYWLLALGELEQPSRRPCLVLVGGLPGSGKSTLARMLAEHAGLAIIRSDAIRKELAGLEPQERVSGEVRTSLYGPEMSERTYRECLRRAEELLFQGKRVLVDANLREEKQRRAFLDAANRWRVPRVLLVCRADPETVKQRLAQRRGDVSDADWSVYQWSSERWEEPSEITRKDVHEIHTESSLQTISGQANEVLRKMGMLNDCSGD
jgi:hypothetical protein